MANEDHLHGVLRTLDATDDAMFIFDADTLRYSFVNDGAVRLVGYSRDELLSMTPMHVNTHDSEADYRHLIATLLDDPNQPMVRRAKLRRHDGTEVEVEKTYQAAPTRSDGSKWVIALARDITDRLRSDADLRASQEALRVAQDRERIARDLHDTVIQRLFGEGLHLLAAMDRVDADTRVMLQTAVDGLDEAIKELRMAIFSLHSSSVSPGGIRGRLLDLVSEATVGLGFDPRLQFDGPIESMDDRIFEHLAPVLREALANVARHARAHSVRVAVSVNREVTLVVTDDGIGTPDQVLGGRGLVNMADRARELGGECTIEPGPSGGSRLR